MSTLKLPSGIVAPEGARAIPLAGRKGAGLHVLVDDADFDLVAPYRWAIIVNDRPRTVCGPYARAWMPAAGAKGRFVRMHKFLTGWATTDHVNHNGLDNRRANLREATNAQNQQNKLKQAGWTSRYKGVHWNKRSGKWRAQVGCNNTMRYLGLFSSEVDAAIAYDAAAGELFGEFACLNFPQDVAA